MFDRLDDLLIRYEELMGELQEPDVANDPERFRKLMKEQSDLAPIIEAYQEYKKCKQNIEDSLRLLEEESDEEMKELAKEELSESRKRVEELEQELESGTGQKVVYVSGDQIPGGGPDGTGSPGRTAAVKRELPAAIPDDIREVVKNFRSIADEASGMIRGYLKKARLSLGGDNRLLIVLPDTLGASVVGREDHVQELTELIEQKIGKKVEIDVRCVEEGRHFEDTFVDIEQKINMEITVED